MQFINGDNPLCSDKVSDKYIAINSCGLYHSFTCDISINRYNGRSDYQLIYLKKGRGKYTINNRDYELIAGDILIYKPYAEQIYTIYADSKPEFNWIHFTGVGVKEILQDAGLYDMLQFNIGTKANIDIYILNILTELQTKRPAYEFISNAYFIEMIGSVSKLYRNYNDNLTSKKYGKIIAIIEHMNKNPGDISTIDDYARQCYIHPYYFISLFKEYTGKSPIEYRTEVKIKAAVSLLSSTSMSMREVAEFLGFKDSLYFSRVFKKHIGKSPNDFRKGD